MGQNLQILIVIYRQLKGNIFFVFFCFVKLFTTCISGTNFLGISAKCDYKNASNSYIES